MNGGQEAHEGSRKSLPVLAPEAKEMLIQYYRGLRSTHGEGHAAAGWRSPESQSLRLEQLTQIGDLNGRDVLEVGSGLGDFYPLLQSRFPEVRYSGVDIVPELVEAARQRFPELSFECRDILQQPLERTYDYVLISGVFNYAIPGATDFLKALTRAAFDKAQVALGFNFISTYVNFSEAEFAYHDPCVVLEHCLQQLSRKTTMFHHYMRADVCVFVYRTT
jgi:SAM-dependent methyltransferase